MSDFVEYGPDDEFPGVIGRTVGESSPAWPRVPRAAAGAPNVVLFVLDDVGFAQPSPFGGACEMPTLDGLASRGLRFANFHATPLCSPTRASLLSGRNHHTVGMGSLAELSMGYPGYHATAGPEYAFLPAMLRDNGYNTFAVGKWHLSPPTETSAAGPYRTWPLGRGFERFYGFMGGDTSQWFPDLMQDNTAVLPPATPAEGYHLNRDMADHAIQFITDAHVAAPNKPFFLYYATGAGHAPHHVEREWVEPYAGRFDQGWDRYREEVFARQLAAGIMPPHTVLSARDPDVPAWDSLSDDAHRMFARQMETYAGFLTQTDHHFGRVLKFLTRIGELDNTIVIAMSDNGASAEGGPEGTFNESLFFNFVPELLADNMKHYDDWGGVHTFPHYSWGWTWAGNTPFRRWKRETYRGGVSEPFIVSWPAGMGTVGGTVRTQYAHAIDVVTTVLDACGIEPPAVVAGVAQKPLHGVSLVPAFADVDAPSARTTQYFEMFGYRSIYHEGWRAVCPFAGPSLAEAAERGRDFRITPVTAELLAEMDAEGWTLFNVDQDPAETTDLAATDPTRLREMIELWYSEAERFGVLPIASAGRGRVTGPRPSVTPGRRQFVFYPGAAPLTFTVAPRIVGRPHAIAADVVVGDDGPIEGILLAQGGRHNGFAFFLLDGHLHHIFNYVGLEDLEVRSPGPVTPGSHTLRYEFQPTGPPVDLFSGKGVPARSKLYVDGALVAVAELPYTLVSSLSFYGMTCGYNAPDSVVPSKWSSPFTCTATIDHVTLDVSGELTEDAEVDLVEVLARQ